MVNISQRSLVNRKIREKKKYPTSSINSVNSLHYVLQLRFRFRIVSMYCSTYSSMIEVVVLTLTVFSRDYSGGFSKMSIV